MSSKAQQPSDSHPDPIREAIFDNLTALVNTTGGNLGYGRFRNETTDAIMTLITTHYTPKAPVTEQPIREADDIKLLIFGWITTILGLPKDGDPTQYNKLTEKLYDLISSTYLPKSQVAGMVQEAEDNAYHEAYRNAMLAIEQLGASVDFTKAVTAVGELFEPYRQKRFKKYWPELQQDSEAANG